MTDRLNLANKLAELPLDQSHDRWPTTKEFRLSEVERDLLVVTLKSSAAQQQNLEKELEELKWGVAEIALAVGWTDVNGKSVLEMVKEAVRLAALAPGNGAVERGNYEDRHPCQLPRNHPIREIMRAVCNMEDRPYNPDDPELLLIGYDELLAVLEDKLGSLSSTEPGNGAVEATLREATDAELRQEVVRRRLIDPPFASLDPLTVEAIARTAEEFAEQGRDGYQIAKAIRASKVVSSTNEASQTHAEVIATIAQKFVSGRCNLSELREAVLGPVPLQHRAGSAE